MSATNEHEKVTVGTLIDLLLYFLSKYLYLILESHRGVGSFYGGCLFISVFTVYGMCCSNILLDYFNDSYCIVSCHEPRNMQR